MREQRVKKQKALLAKYDVFISHSRRTGDNEIALMIYQQLKQDYRVYLDLMIDENGRFDKRLEKHVKNCQDFILIVPKENIKHSPWVREEVEWAMASGKNIIPIVLGTDNNLEERFPETLRDIAKINWIEYHEKRTDDIIKLIKKRMDTIPGYEKLCGIMGVFVPVVLFALPIVSVVKPENLYLYIGIEIILLIFSINSFFMDSWIRLLFFIKKMMHISYKKQLISYIEYENWKKVQGCRGLKIGNIIEWCIRALGLPTVVIIVHVIAMFIFNEYNEWPPWIVSICIELISIKEIYILTVICLKYEEYRWKKNREIIVFCGTVDENKTKLKDSEKFKNWIYQMCEEDVLFTVKGNWGLWKTIYEIIEGYVEGIPDLEVKDFWIEEKNFPIESKNRCFICFSNQKEVQYLPKCLVFADSESMPEDKGGTDNVIDMKKIDDIGKYVNIMKLKIYSENVN